MTLNLTPDGYIEGSILRTARKAHRCEARPCLRPERTIAPGERYVEYLGESGAYESGSRYHLGGCADQQLKP